MNIESLKGIIDVNWVALMFAWGLLCKYVPALSKLSNQSIPWVNFAAFVLSKLVVGTAHAGGIGGLAGVIPDVAGVIIGGFTNAIWARQLYEGFGRGILERVLRLKKAPATYSG